MRYLSWMDKDRRQFLQSALVVGGGVLTGGPLLARARSRVAVVRRPDAVARDGQVRAALVKKMVFKAVAQTVGVTSPAQAFASLFSKNDVVGIKVNCLAGKRMSTRPEVALALADGLRLAGVKPGNIVIWERSSRELERAGYQLQKDNFAPRVIGTDGNYDKQPIDAGSVGGCLTRIVSSMCTRQINVPVLKDHDLAGVSLGMKNYFGAIHNPNKYHDNQCAPYVADLAAYPLLKKQTALVVCDALFAQCHGGPAYVAEYCRPYGAIIASTDQVAADAVGSQLLEKMRHTRGLPTLVEAGRPPRWLAQAAQRGLGVADSKQILLIER